ncbi:MAG: hypothetical protein JWO94_260 [Verrucomicrobiaceae bacterium]|nr:hypothetical protein [Verrucomicrobiaceae bacterium]
MYKLAIVLATKNPLARDSHGEFNRRPRHVLPVLRDRHVYQDRLWDPATEGLAFGATLAKLADDTHRYEHPWHPLAIVVEVPDEASTPIALADEKPPATFDEAWQMLPRLLTPEDQRDFLLHVSERLASMQKLGGAFSENEEVDSVPLAPPEAAATPSAAELLEQDAEIPDEEEPQPETAAPAVAVPEPVAAVEDIKAVPEAGELVIDETPMPPVAVPAPAPKKRRR